MSGTWEVDRSKDTGCLDAFLALEGVSYLRRKAILGMAIREDLALTKETLRIDRYTSWGNTQSAHHLGGTGTRDEQDTLLGAVKVRGEASDDLYRVQVVKTRTSDRAVFIGTRHVPRTELRRLVYAMNFTLPDGRHAECVRHYNKV
jgi:hypothetical protein